MNIRDTQDRIIEFALIKEPDAALMVDRARGGTKRCTGELSDFQAVALYAITSDAVTRPAAKILELGTAYGFTAAVMALAAPSAYIITLNPQLHEVIRAGKDLAGMGLRNVSVVHAVSWDYYATYTGPRLDMVFVDGDHARVRRDFVWWKWLRPGGLMLFHDYAPEGTWRACPPVYEALNWARREMERDFDVAVIDEAGVGMVGYRKQEDDKWPIPE